MRKNNRNPPEVITKWSFDWIFNRCQYVFGCSFPKRLGFNSTFMIFQLLLCTQFELRDSKFIFFIKTNKHSYSDAIAFCVMHLASASPISMTLLQNLCVPNLKVIEDIGVLSSHKHIGLWNSDAHTQMHIISKSQIENYLFDHHWLF